MTLPKKPLPTEEIEVEGERFSLRSLSRLEVLRLTGQYTRETADDAEIYALSCGANVSLDEAREWLATTDPETAGLVIDRIMQLSGLLTKPGKDGQPDDPKTNGRARSSKAK